MKKLIVVFLLGFAISGCGKKQESKHHESASGANAVNVEAAASVNVVRKAHKDEMGKSAECPVMGSKFEVGDLTSVIDYEGKNYYFCCAGCPDMFRKDPEKYMKI
jgi:YHS domain-containing protein